jgi:tetratricopeptide (TPR) repeat protein
MFGYSRSLAAFALEAGGMLSLFAYGNSQALFAGYLAAHAVASALLASVLLPVLSARQRTRPAAAFAFFFCVSFFVPLLGFAGLLGTALVGRLLPERARREQFEMHRAPVYAPRDAEAASVRSKGGVRLHLENSQAPVETRLKALLAVQSLPARVANPLVREMLSDPSDDLRLVAYGILDAREKSINARIHSASQRLAAEPLPPARERAALERQLADLYWELIYQGLVQGDLREHAVAQARNHLDQALSLDPEDAGLWSLCGRLAAMEGGYDEAQRAFERARLLGQPESRVLPYLAEVAFRRRAFDEVRELARKMGAASPTQRIAQVVAYWDAAPESPPMRSAA